MFNSYVIRGYNPRGNIIMFPTCLNYHWVYQISFHRFPGHGTRGSLWHTEICWMCEVNVVDIDVRIRTQIIVKYNIR